jgi:hypothetical protein
MRRFDDCADHVPALPKKRGWFRRIVYLFGGLFVLFLILLPLIFVMISRARDSEIQKRVAELDQSDPGWRYQDILASREAIPDSENAALVVLSAYSKLPKPWRPKLTPATPADDNMLPFGFAGPPLPEPSEDAPPGESPPGSGPMGFVRPIQAEYLDDLVRALPTEAAIPEHLAREYERTLRSANAALVEIRKLSKMSLGRFPILHDPNNFLNINLTMVQEAREVAALASMEIDRLTMTGQGDKALEICRGILIGVRSMGDETTMISMLVRIAIDAVCVSAIERIVARTEPSEDALLETERLLESLGRDPILLCAARGERAGTYQMMKAIIEGKQSMAAFGPTGGGKLGAFVANRSGSFLARQSLPELLEFHTQFVEAARLPIEKRDDSTSRIPMPTSMFGRLLLPAYQKLVDAEVRWAAYNRIVRLLLATERFRRIKGTWPNTLSDLVEAKLLDQIPIDPHNGKPLRMKKIGVKIAIYSVGPDKLDDGGHHIRSKPLEKGTDLAFYLWNPTARSVFIEPIVSPRSIDPPPDAAEPGVP